MPGLGEAACGVTVRRANPADESIAWELVEEYNRAVDVAVPDERAGFRAYLAGPGAMWLAQTAGGVAGCVVLRPLKKIGAAACEVKRLYVRPAHRGVGIAGALMEALEDYARSAGYEWAYLDSKDDLEAAIRFYRARGYEQIERYNDNPQATIFMRRRLL